MDLFISFIKDHHFHFDQTTIVCKTLKQKLSEVENIPSDHFSLQSNGRFISDDELIIDAYSTLRATLCHGLKGGKGGFGAMLRKKAKEKGPKKTVDFGACRDLSGRRIRHVNDEIILKKWQEAKDRGEAFNVDQETPSGINLWFLPTPTWTDGFGKKSKNKLRQSKRKTTLCSDWMEAHGPNRRVPKNASIWWGCPRGNRCDYAHGEGELEATTRQTLQETKKRELLDAESEKLNTYLNPLNSNNSESSGDDIADLVMVGLSKTFKRPRYNNNNNNNNIDTSTVTQKDTVSNINNSSSSSAAQSNLDSEADKGVADEEDTIIESDSEVEDELKLLSSESHCELLQCLAGDAVIMEDGAVLGQNEFSTVSVRNCQLAQDAWYYEVELLTDGLMQIGWACVGFQLSEEGDGVGDDLFSWSYDGYRCKKWHVEDTDYGSYESSIESDDKTKLKSSAVAKVTSRSKTASSSSSSSITTSASKISASKGVNTKWKAGDVIGCYLELIHATTTEDIGDSSVQKQSTVRMVFYKNCSSLGEAFSFQYPESSTSKSNSSSNSKSSNSDGDVNSIGFFPALSVDSFQQVVVNIGQTPFKHNHQEKVIENTTIFKTVLNEKDQSTSTEKLTTGCDNSNRSSTAAAVKVSTAPVDTNGNFLPLDLESDDYKNIESLEYLGANYLKFELMRRGLKFGGTVEEKAKRLFSVRGVAEKDINVKLKAATIGVIKTDVKK